eukprot:TRINITY_DN9391_c0_g2_i1.p1 TRINITY_DN9391_c0_g2~~TRINITY_DN9391_c0_g2_i1.p1  ORF type:complete len:410 (+),score=134.18 TRINITY_DN9391_c0_g2_i1:703-1932(+)
MVAKSVLYGVMNVSYYLILFTSYIGISIYSFRTFDRKERASFFYEMQTHRELGKWRALLNDLPEPVILAQNGIITFFNTATQKFFDLRPRATSIQLLQELDNVLPLNSSSTSVTDLIKNPQAGFESKGFSYKGMGGKKHRLQVKHVVIDSLSGVPMIEFIFHDVTAIEELERERTQRYCSGVLVSSVSHEIRTPVNAIKVVLHTFSDIITNEKQYEEMRIANVSMDRLELYVKELAILQQLETGTLKLTQELFNPNDVVEKIMEHFSYAAKTRGLCFKLYENNVGSITSDKEKYEIALYHIIENALKYTYEGGISIRLSYCPEDDILSTSIIDTGCAVYNYRQPAFKYFAPKDDFDVAHLQDVNLGLFLADSLATALGGALRLESLVDIGTRATLSVKCSSEELNEEDV